MKQSARPVRETSQCPVIMPFIVKDGEVVDLTTANPNVYYELGVRHALRGRVTVLLRRRGTKNPFNIAEMTTIDHELSPAALERAKAEIGAFIVNGLMSGACDSLMHTVLRGLRVERRASTIADGAAGAKRPPTVPSRKRRTRR